VQELIFSLPFMGREKDALKQRAAARRAIAHKKGPGGSLRRGLLHFSDDAEA